MRRFLWAHLPVDSSLFVLPEEESKHIVRVLRMQEGEKILLLNGEGTVLHVQITDAHPKHCSVQVMCGEQKQRPENGFHLALAPTKNTERMEWMIEKIAEIGAQRLSFLECDHSERIRLNYDRFERVAISAMKQAQHDFLLKIDPIRPFNDFLSEFPQGAIAHCASGEKTHLSHAKINGPVLIGPEGDFSSKELLRATELGYLSVTLGNARLRTETAGMVAAVLKIIH